MSCWGTSFDRVGTKAPLCKVKAICVVAVLLLTGGGLGASAQSQGAAAGKGNVTVAPDGTVTVQSEVIPMSNLLSPEAKAYVTQHLKDMQTPATSVQENGIPRYMQPYLDQARAMYPVDQKDTNIAGVHVYVFTPKGGVAAENAKRVLINLHGGGFQGCWPGCALLESIPISSVGKFKVVSVDYREAPQYHFPAASEDVAKVYAELLKEYEPQNIGIYGCSAGGALTAMSIAWFEKHDLPIPGAAGLFCSGAGAIGDGDSLAIATPAGEARTFQSVKSGITDGYWQGSDPSDPLVQQANHLDVLAKFPPTLFVTGTRDMALSNALYTNQQMNKAGVETSLFVWEGLFHGFFYNPGIPESQHVYRVVTAFFDKKLGK
jgi:epsilon-lactone hydrolase